MILPSLLAPIAGPLGFAHRTSGGCMRIDLDAARRRRRLTRWTLSRLAICAVVFACTVVVNDVRGSEPPPPQQLSLVERMVQRFQAWWGIKPRVPTARKYIGGDG